MKKFGKKLGSKIKIIKNGISLRFENQDDKKEFDNFRFNKTGSFDDKCITQVCKTEQQLMLIQKAINRDDNLEILQILKKFN